MKLARLLLSWRKIEALHREIDALIVDLQDRLPDVAQRLAKIKAMLRDVVGD
jgi:uncharacterized membrane protein